jgi:carboxyl-terminal processing protease
LGNDATIAAFDNAMAQAKQRQSVILDLTDTPSGGNTTIARAILGWFISAPTFYQMHSLPAEERQSGIPRQWVEQVLPRAGKHHRGPVSVRVGRWTGSMGEGIAIGFDAIGARVAGSRMAGLLGAIYDYRLEKSGQVIKFPTERLFAVNGKPREKFVPEPLAD